MQSAHSAIASRYPACGHPRQNTVTTRPSSLRRASSSTSEMRRAQRQRARMELKHVAVPILGLNVARRSRSDKRGGARVGHRASVKRRSAWPTRGGGHGRVCQALSLPLALLRWQRLAPPLLAAVPSRRTFRMPRRRRVGRERPMPRPHAAPPRKPSGRWATPRVHLRILCCA